MTPDYRILITKMADELDQCHQLLMDDRRQRHPLADRARTLLAEPETEGPSDEEIISQADKFLAYSDAHMGDPARWEGSDVDLVAFIRHALARWGRPTPQPVPVSERLPGPEDCDVEDNCWWFDPHADGAWYVDTFQSCYTHWLPANALPTPEATND